MFKFNLQPVLNHRQFIEDSLQKEYAHLKSRLAKQQDRLVRLEHKQQHLTEELHHEQHQETTSSALLLYVDFLDQLHADIKQLVEKIMGLENQAALKRAELLAAMKNRKALEKLKEKKVSEHMAILAKAEQAFLDEIGINRHGRENP
jgi:flagellar FliJ protein